MLKASCVEVNGVKVKDTLYIYSARTMRYLSHDCQDMQHDGSSYLALSLCA